MKLKHISKSIDSETFTPIFDVHLQISLELLQDGSIMMSEEQFATVVGLRLLEILKQNGVNA